jgi:hypothetical protein
MKSIHIEFQHFNTNQENNDVDIICIDKTLFPKVIACTFAYIQVTDNQFNYNVSVKFEFKEDYSKPAEDDFLFIPETDTLFFRSTHQWGAIDLKNKHLKRHEWALNFPFLYKEENFVLIHDELYAESVTFNGDLIDHVPIDPPYEMEEFEDRIEYKCEIFGHQILKTR